MPTRARAYSVTCTAFPSHKHSGRLLALLTPPCRWLRYAWATLLRGFNSRCPGPGIVELVRRRQASNLRLLKDAGVQIVVGSDNVDDVGAAEFDYLASLDVFTNVELVRLWSETTPQAIFPKRRIGRIAPRYEASFIVLSRNPLDDLAATDEIVRRFKHGVEIVAAR